MIRTVIFFLGFAILSCGQTSPDQPTTDINPDTTTDGSGKELKDIVEYYNDSFVELGPISFHEKWDKWLVGTESTFAQYPDLETYQEDNPFAVTVDIPSGYLKVIDEGTGGGTFTVTAALFKKADGTYLLTRTEVASTAEETETELFFATYENGKMAKQTPINVAPDTFFSDKKATVGKYPLVSVIYTLPQQGTDLVVSVSPNYPYHCKNGKFPAASSMEAAEVKEICEAWKYFKEEKIVYAWDKDAGSFSVR